MLAGGCNSPVRSGWAVGGSPFIQTRGEGAYAFDQCGERFIDYIMAYGPLLFGHTHEALVRGLDALSSQGFVFGSTHPEELRLAQRIGKHLLSMQSIRFTTTGTEAVMSAIRTARAFTGRSLVVKFAGNYHGHSDFALLQAGASANTSGDARSGIPRGVMDDVITVRYNDLIDLDAAICGRERDIAAIIVEPIAANMGLVMPEPGFLEGLRQRTNAFASLLIFDEIITWLRFGLGGAQNRVGIMPDLTTIGKIMGGGLPIAAFGGREDVMRVLAPAGSTFTGGTHAANPFCVGVAHRVLDILETNAQLYVEMRASARRLAAGIRGMLAELALPYEVVQEESIVDFKFRPGVPSKNYDDARAADASLYAAYYHDMRGRHILLPPSQNEVMFLSTAHSAADVDETLGAFDGALRALADGNRVHHRAAHTIGVDGTHA